MQRRRYTSADFAAQSCRSAASPIRVERWQKKGRTLTFSFLYEHEDNAALLREGVLTLWDERGRQVARGKIVPEPKAGEE